MHNEFLLYCSLGRFEKTNETLTRVNSLSEIRYEVISRDFRKHIVTLLEMKQNLDAVFKRIRSAHLFLVRSD